MNELHLFAGAGYQEWKEARQGDVRVGVFRRPDDGLAPEVDELKALGNGQVPAVAATAFLILFSRFQNGKEAL